jgi:hypothetical protein
MATPLRGENDVVAPHVLVCGIRVAILSRSGVFVILELLGSIEISISTRIERKLKVPPPLSGFWPGDSTGPFQGCCAVRKCAWGPGRCADQPGSTGHTSFVRFAIFAFSPTLESLALESSGVAETNSVGGGVLRDLGIIIALASL